jgi:hypothetical protein
MATAGLASITAALAVATSNQNFSSPIVLALFAVGGLCLLGAFWVFGLVESAARGIAPHLPRVHISITWKRQGYRRARLAAVREELESPLVDFACTAYAEKTDDVLPIWSQTYRDIYRVWLRIENHGDNAEFSAWVRSIEGVPWVNYEMPELSWEGGDPAKRSAEISGNSGTRRIKLLDIACVPRALWFYTTRNGKEEYAEQWRIWKDTIPGAEVRVRFDLEVANQATGEKRLWKGWVTSPPLLSSETPEVSLTQVLGQ